MKPTFREDKAAQVASVFLGLAGGRMSKIKLIKLLYITEREALIRWRRPVIFDRYVSMDRGPVVSKTLDIMNGEESDREGPWDAAISRPDKDFVVEIKNDPGADELSDAEEGLVREVFNRYGSMDQWDLCNFTHSFPEWTDPHGSSIPIEYRDILKGAGKTDVEIASTLDELENLALIDRSMGR